jgi:hypothetical protein
VLHWTILQARGFAAGTTIGPRMIATDCTAASMPDTPALRAHFGLPRRKKIKPGVAYPILKLQTLIDLASVEGKPCTRLSHPHDHRAATSKLKML